MKTGQDYISSAEKRSFDIVTANLLAPIGSGVGLLMRSSIRRAARMYYSQVFEQERVGRAEERFTIRKLRTENPQTDLPFNKLALILRRLGLDELPQTQNVREGSMSIVGWRPRIPEEHEAIRDKLPPKLGYEWQIVVDNTKPGVISSYGNYHHVHHEEDPNEAEIIAENDIRDFHEASLVHDVSLVTDLGKLVVTRKLL